MNRTKQKEVEQLLAEWSERQAAHKRITAKRDRLLQPLREQFDASANPINEQAAAKLRPIEEEINALEKQIKAAMLAEADANGSVSRLSTATAEALVTTTSRREINPQTFFNNIPEDEHGHAFWSCFSVLIGRAEKFLGDGLGAIASLKHTHNVSIRAKE